MKTKILHLFLVLAFSIPIWGIAQMNFWTMPPNIFNVATQTVAPLPGGSTNPYVNSNGAFDENGNLLFYVYVSNGIQVRSATGALVGTLNVLPYTCNTPNSMIAINQQEISIVPVPGVCKQYYVIWLYANPVLTGLTLGYAKIDVSSGVSIAQQSTPVFCMPGNSGAIAVTKILQNKRYLLTLANGSLRRHTITSTGIGSGITMASSLPGNTFINELEVNPNGNRILYGDVWQGNAYVSTVNVAAGTYSGTSTYTITGNGKVKGAEFNASGNMFYVCTTTGMFWSTTGSGGAMVAIPNSSNYTNSQIEYGKDGYLYVVSNAGALARFHPTIMAITPLTAPPVTAFSNQVAGISQETAYRLPDQIDGEVYDYSACGVTLTTSQSLLSASCSPLYLATGCPNGSCMRRRFCLNVKNTGTCAINAGTTVIFSLDPRLKICNAPSTPAATYITALGGLPGANCTPAACCAYTGAPNFQPTVIYSLTAPINANATTQICIDVQTSATALNLCTNPLVTTALVTGACPAGGTFSKTTAITYGCCSSPWNPNAAVAMMASPQGCSADHFISPNETLTYSVGTQDGAPEVSGVSIPMDENLDLSTLEVTSLTEFTQAELTADNVLEITFQDGVGEVVYTVKPLTNLPEGTVITSDAVARLANGLPTVPVDGEKRTISYLQSLSLNEIPVAYYAPNCSGPVTLTAEALGGSGGYTYEWSSGETDPSITVSPDNTCAYAVRAIDQSGCISNWQSTGVIVGPMAVVACDDQTVNPAVPGEECAELYVVGIHGGTPPYTYLWSDGSEAPTTVVCPPSDQNFTVKITDANGCSAQEDVYVFAYNGQRLAARPDATVALPTEAVVFTAVPNPFTMRSTLRFSLPASGTANLTVFDHLGRSVAVLFNGNLEAMELHEVDFVASNLSAGIYFARLIDAQGHSHTLKLALRQ